MSRDERVNYLARVLAVLAGYQADADRAAEWLQAMLADDATEDHLEQVTTSLIDSINRRNTAGLLLAQRAIELERQKRKPD